MPWRSPRASRREKPSRSPCRSRRIARAGENPFVAPLRALQRLVFAPLLLAASLARAGAPPQPASPLLAVGDLSVEAASRRVRDLRLSIGAGTAFLREGSAALVTGSGGEPAGLFLSGKGTFEYVSRDPREHPAVRYAVRKNTGLSPSPGEGGLVVRDSFETLLWLASGVPLPPLPA